MTEITKTITVAIEHYNKLVISQGKTYAMIMTLHKIASNDDMENEDKFFALQSAIEETLEHI